MMRQPVTVVLLAACVMLGGCVTGRRAADGVTPSEAAAGFNLQLGVAYLKEGNLPLAKEKLERALSQDPRDANVHSALALLEDRLGHVAEADKYFRTALRLAPQSPDISNNYAIYLCRTHREAEGVERFLAVANNALYAAPATAFTNAGVCLRGANKLDAAAAAFERALQIQPNYAEAAYQLADLELTRGHPAQSRAVIDRFMGSFVNVTPEMLLLALRAARTQGDRLGEERYARRLRLDFPNSEQTRSLTPAAPPRNPG